MLEFVPFKKMQTKIINFLFVIPILFIFVGSHELPKQSHGHYTFGVLQESVDGDSLSTDDVNRLFTKLHFLNCSENKTKEDFRRCFSPNNLYQFGGSSGSRALNASDFLALAPVLVYCLLPAPEKNSGNHLCVTPKNHSELYDSFLRNFSQQEEGITHEALDKILEDVNKTIGEFLSKSKCFSAESIFEEVHDSHGKEEDDHHEKNKENHENETEHDHKEEKTLDQDDFQKACASIIFHLVQGFCIEEGHEHNKTSTSTLPSKEFFLNNLFEGKTHMSEEDLEPIVMSLGIGKKSESSETESDGHNHRRKRSVHHQQELRWQQHVIRRRAADDDHDHDHDHDHGSEENNSNNTCYSLDDLLTIYGVDHSVGVDKFDFKELCPAFIQQVKSKACHSSSEKVKAEDKDLGKIWGYGFAAVTIISITSLVGVTTIPFLGKKLYKKILAMLVALAVGTLAGDSLLHLLPHAFGLHEHKENVGTEHDHEEDSAFIWKALVVLASIYGFFLFETLMHLCLKSKIGDHGGHSHIDVKLPGPSSRHMSFKKKRSCSNFEHHEGGPPIGKKDEKPPLGNGDIVLKNITARGDLDKDHSGIPHDSEVKPKRTLKQSLSRRSVFSDEEMEHAKPPNKISAVAWMIIIGDTLHNISDGLAIGAAFSEGGSSGISGGISTSIAVFCHELPHELGDFAVLLTAGMSVKMALLANLLSALSCYIGLAIGIYIGQTTDVRFWIFAIAAGMFLYVSLVDMLPDLMHSESLQTEPAATFVYQNFGLLLGICIMLVIALYEEDLMAVQF